MCNMKGFCTIISADYAPYVVALYKSLYTYDESASLQVLVIDDGPALKMLDTYPGIKLVGVKALFNYGLVHALHKKYAHIEPDHFRWALKPVFMCYLLENGYDKIIFTDCDIFFFNAYSFLFDELDSAGILLTPHWINADPLADESSFFTLFTDGFFNAGFIGSNKKGLPALHWWANACHYKMGSSAALGIHDDQRYLDVLPVKFETVKIIRHQGCNIGGWNRLVCQRIPVENSVLINNLYPIIFIHFNGVLMQEILKGYDPHLLPYLQKYQSVFEEEGVTLASSKKKLPYYLQANALMKLKWKLRIRTRIKTLLFNFAETI